MREERTVNDRGVQVLRRTYDSLMDWCDDARESLDVYRDLVQIAFGYADDEENIFNKEQSGIRTFAEVETLCRDGWTEKLPETLDVVHSAVRRIEAEIEMFEPVFSPAGADVNMPAAIAGLPEDMIAYPLTRVSDVGTTVAICADVQVPWMISGKTVTDRGMIVAALALALEAAGHQTELWVSDEHTNGKCRCIMRALVKGPNDIVDPARIVYAFAHPSVQQVLGFCTVTGLPYPWSRIPQTHEKFLGTGGPAVTYGPVTPMTKDFPEGTIYFQPVTRNTDNPNAEAEVMMYLTQLGIIAGDDDY